jgi:hypothetical protein
MVFLNIILVNFDPLTLGKDIKTYEYPFAKNVKLNNIEQFR